MQLVAYGAQDIYLTGSPQITFFKIVYRRHTNFSIESIEQTFNGTGNFGTRSTVAVSRNGDLIMKAYLRVVLPAVAATGTHKWVRHVGQQLINNVEVEIGGQRIDKHYGDWLHIWNELTQDSEKELGYNEMIGDVYRLRGLPIDATLLTGGTPQTELHIPMQFWFNRNPGLALPLIALQYHEVKFNFEFRPHSELIDPNGTHTYSTAEQTLVSNSLYIDYVYLDTDERRRFAQVSHEYLVEQLQFTGEKIVRNQNEVTEINFNHPLKELVWVFNPADNEAVNERTDYVYESGAANNYDIADDGISGNPLNVLSECKIQLNGHDRFSTRSARYFNLVQPYQHHTGVPTGKGIYVYSFAVNPESHQPSGSANMSRIDNATFRFTLDSTFAADATTAKLRLYAVNYNVLRIMSGMAGLAYSN